MNPLPPFEVVGAHNRNKQSDEQQRTRETFKVSMSRIMIAEWCYILNSFECGTLNQSRTPKIRVFVPLVEPLAHQ